MISRTGRFKVRHRKDALTVADFDADYVAILDRATALGYTLPGINCQLLGNALVVDLKAAGVWAKEDVIYVKATTGDSSFATLNWKSPTTHQLTLVNSPTFTSKSGFNSDGSTSYLASTYNPATFGGQRTLNSAGITHFTFGAPPSGFNSVLGGSSASNVDGAVVTGGSGTSVLSRLHNGTTSLPAGAALGVAGFQRIARPDSATLNLYTGDGVKVQRSVTSTSISNAVMHFLKRGPATFTRTEVTLGYSATGGAMSDAEVAAYRTALNAYMTQLVTIP